MTINRNLSILAEGASSSGVLGTANGGTGLTSSGTSGNVLTSNGSAWVSSAPVTGGLSWQSVQASNFSATVGNGYPVNTTSSAITVTLPASPTAGSFITLSDYAGTWGTYAVIINPNGKNINGSSSNKIISSNRYSVNLVYIDATQGWISYADNTTNPVNANYSISYLAVGGGGGGGAGRGAGGGAGGLLANTQTLTYASTYTVTVGSGGTGGTSSTPSIGTNGGDSSISGTGVSVTATGELVG